MYAFSMYKRPYGHFVATETDEEPETKPIVFKGVPEIKKAQNLSVKVYFENHLMCYQKYALSNSEY